MRFDPQQEIPGGKRFEVPSLGCSLAVAACKPGLRREIPEPVAAEVDLPGVPRSLLGLEVEVVRHIAGLEVVLRVLLVVPVEISQHEFDTGHVTTSSLCISLKYC